MTLFAPSGQILKGQPATNIAWDLKLLQQPACVGRDISVPFPDQYHFIAQSLNVAIVHSIIGSATCLASYAVLHSICKITNSVIMVTVMACPMNTPSPCSQIMTWQDLFQLKSKHLRGSAKGTTTVDVVPQTMQD